MSRLPDWQSRLHTYLISHFDTTFAYGTADCGLFAAGAIEAMTGVDVATSLRGTYTSRKAAFAAVKATCGKATMGAMAEHLMAVNGFEEVPVLMAQRGDLVLMSSGAKASLGIIAMHGTEVLQLGKHGILRMPLSTATRAWHI